MDKASKLVWPTRGQVYTLDVFEKLELRDSPCLRFQHNGQMMVIQDSHTDGIEGLCENAEFAATRWSFVRETDEWIPVFQYVGERPITDFVTIEEGRGSRYRSDAWVCWKGHHRPQLTPFEVREEERRFEEDWEEARVENMRIDLRKALTKPEPVEVPPFSFKEVIDSIINPVVPSYSSEELASDPVKAEHYLLSRPKDVGQFSEKTPLVWEKVNMAVKKAKLYEAGYIEQHAGWSHWGNYQANTPKGGYPHPPVRFKTYECFVAWTLQRFW